MANGFQFGQSLGRLSPEEIRRMREFNIQAERGRELESLAAPTRAPEQGPAVDSIDRSAVPSASLMLASQGLGLIPGSSPGVSGLRGGATGALGGLGAAKALGLTAGPGAAAALSPGGMALIGGMAALQGTAAVLGARSKRKEAQRQREIQKAQVIGNIRSQELAAKSAAFQSALSGLARALG